MLSKTTVNSELYLQRSVVYLRTGVHHLYTAFQDGRLTVPVITVMSMTSSLNTNLTTTMDVDDIKCATDGVLAGKVAVVAGYGDVDKGVRFYVQASHLHNLILHQCDESSEPTVLVS